MSSETKEKSGTEDEAIGQFLASVFGFPPSKGRQVFNALHEDGVSVDVDLSDADLTIEGACGFGAPGELFMKRFRDALPILRGEKSDAS